MHRVNEYVSLGCVQGDVYGGNDKRKRGKTPDPCIAQCRIGGRCGNLVPSFRKTYSELIERPYGSRGKGRPDVDQLGRRIDIEVLNLHMS
jgi:hypothetical protein